MLYSAGIIPYRTNEKGELEFFVGHPGGPFWADKNYWALLKGEIMEHENAYDAAIREFYEESGIRLTDDEKDSVWYVGFVLQRSDKIVTAYALEKADINPECCFSNIADGCDWPEIDSYAWITYDKILPITHPTHRAFFENIKNGIA